MRQQECNRSAGILPAVLRPVTPEKITGKMPPLRFAVCPNNDLPIELSMRTADPSLCSG